MEALKNNRKRILFFVPAFPVLSETFIERELCELQRRGNIDLQIISLKKGSEFKCADLRYCVNYINLTAKDIIFGLMSFLIRRPSAVVKIFAIGLQNKNRNILGNCYILIKSFGFAQIFSKYKPEQIHAHFLSEPSTIALYVAILLGAPYSISGHARDVFGESEITELKPELIKQKIRYAKFVALCNEKAYAKCVSIASPKDKLKVQLIYHGVEIQNSSNQKSINEIPVLFFAGRFVEKKGISYLLDAVKDLKDAGEKFKLNIIGFGPCYSELLMKRNELSLGDVVNFYGDGRGVNNQELLTILNGSDISIVPSVDLNDGDSDGIPNTVLEAGIFNIPVVATNAGSIKEIIKNEQTGLLVEQKNSNVLATGIKKLIDDPDLRNKLGSNLGKLVRQHFDIKQNILELEKLLLS